MSKETNSALTAEEKEKMEPSREIVNKALDDLQVNSERVRDTFRKGVMFCKGYLYPEIASRDKLIEEQKKELQEYKAACESYHNSNMSWAEGAVKKTNEIIELKKMVKAGVDSGAELITDIDNLKSKIEEQSQEIKTLKEFIGNRDFIISNLETEREEQKREIEKIKLKDAESIFCLNELSKVRSGLESQLKAKTEEADRWKQEHELRCQHVKNYAELLKTSEEKLKAKEEMTENTFKAYEQYIKILCDEIKSMVSLAVLHGWKSSNIEKGQTARSKIAELLTQYRKEG